jgi:hypothetical protein
MVKRILGGIYVVVGFVFLLSAAIPNSGGGCALAIAVPLIIYGAVNVFSK